MAQRELEQAQKKEEIRQQIGRVQLELEQAKENAQPTSQLEAELTALRERMRAIYKPPPWDPIHLAWPVLRAKIGELQEITPSRASLSLEHAQRLVDMLYINIEPRLNCNLQFSILRHIHECAQASQLSEDVRRFLRNSVLDYYNATRDQCDEKNRGPMCSPWSMTLLAQAIASVTSIDDAEALEAFNHLKAANLEKCGQLQWEREGAILAGVVSRAEESLSLRDDEVGSISYIANAALSEEDVARLLKTYRKVLRGPARRVTPDVVSTIDRNLLNLARRGLSRKNWELWADATLALGPERASRAMRDLILQPDEAVVDTRSKEFGRVRQIYSRFALAP